MNVGLLSVIRVSDDPSVAKMSLNLLMIVSAAGDLISLMKGYLLK